MKDIIEGPEHRPEKAYKNLRFLSSPDARAVRVLCEFMEPQSRFRKYNIRDTVVFFGSARIKTPAEADVRVQKARAALDGDGNKHADLERAYDEALRGREMARYYEDARTLSHRVTEWSLGLPDKGYRFTICSGGGPGIMQAANQGARDAGGLSIGLNISLPFEEAPNPYLDPKFTFEFHYFFIRKFWFVYLAKALVVFPGGFGTMDELFEILTLVQNQKTSKTMPIILYGSEFWNTAVNFEALADWGMISRGDLDLFTVCDTVDSAFEHLTTELDRLYLRKPRKRKE